MKRVLLIVLVVACTGSNDEKLQAQSVETHNLAISIGEHVSDKIQQIAIHVGRVEAPLKSHLQDSVEALILDYTNWESTIVEVPGNEHHEHNHAGKNHNHTPSPDLTPEMLLDIQKDLRDRIVKLNIRAQKILDILKKNEENEPVEEKEKAPSDSA